jgi:hypothetical protein
MVVSTESAIRKKDPCDNPPRPFTRELSSNDVAVDEAMMISEGDGGETFDETMNLRPTAWVRVRIDLPVLPWTFWVLNYPCSSVMDNLLVDRFDICPVTDDRGGTNK